MMKNILSLFLFFVFIQLQVIAQNESNVPQLNKHYFVPVSTIPSPFIKSSFTTNIGIAQSSEFENLILEIDGEKIVGLKGSLLFADLDFDYQQKIKNWIALYINYNLTARVGTEFQSFIAQGVSTVSTFRFGWLIKVLERDNLMLSFNIQVNNHSATFINVSEFVKDFIRDSTVTSISRQIPMLNMNGGLRFAYGINKVFGLQCFGDLGYGDSYRRGKSDYIYRLGGAIDANVSSTTKVPLGFSYFISSSALPDFVHVAGKSALNTGFKISYTAAPHFNIGVELSRLIIPIPNLEEKVKSTSVFISSKYYFN